MNVTSVAKVLGDVTSHQWGLVTTQQAEIVGIGRLQLSRMASAGALRRIRQGVYLDSGAPEDRLTNLRAQWLALKPAEFAFDRIRQPHLEPVLAATSAAWAYQAGSFMPAPYVFHVPSRIQKSSDLVKLRVRRYEPEQIALHEGLPITSPTQTVIDLIRYEGEIDAAFEVAAEFGPSRIDFAKIELEVPALSRAIGISIKDLRRMLVQLAQDLSPLSKNIYEVSRASEKLLAQFSELNLDSNLKQQLLSIREGVENIQQQIEAANSVPIQKDNY